eukprot:TRINITY_DN5745_c0_g1_i1.p1 TRINITY_DN5745_c0_g1~~TRINITY_DN5745_c0_g1_i1.p1  ORF type:complete len:185 (-),score=58.98 TRINITY_DN5745_c0_g1_i1:358-912(-)
MIVLVVTDDVDTCVAVSGCAISVDGPCICHYCDCETIDAMSLTIDDWFAISTQCDDCDECSMYEGCDSADMEAMMAMAYIRDPQTGTNINDQFVAQDTDIISITATQLQRKEIANIVIAVTIGIVVVIVLVICSGYVCSRYRSGRGKHRFEEQQKDVEDQEAVEDSEDVEDGKAQFTVDPYQHN